MKTLAIITGVIVLGLSAAAAGSSTSVAKPVADAGHYAGRGVDGSPLTFFVSPGSRNVLNISIPGTVLPCSPGGGYRTDDTFAILKTVLRPGGSFRAKGSQNGVSGNDAVRFSYSFAGRFSKATKQHTATATGSFREDITFTDTAGVHHVCTTNTKAWTASRSGSIPALKSLVRQGNYAGRGADGSALTFAVAPSRVNNISIPGTVLPCSGVSYKTDDTFAIPQVAVRPDGSFSAKRSQNGVNGGQAVLFSYSFSGSFQGLNPNRVGSAAGVFREDITFTDTAGVHHICTTNTKAWTATRSS
jgi:hypothetical protein